MSRRLLVLASLLALGGCTAASSGGRETPAPERPRSVILMIGDGVGVAYWTAANLAVDNLNIKRFPVSGLVDTRSTSSRVTDSAAGATAYASGIRTYNGAIGVTPDTVPVPTVLELAKEKGLATGIVATSRINHATPAAFVAHVANRGWYADIAAQTARLQPNVVLGGGRDYFDGTRRPDSLNLLPSLMEDYAYADSPAALQAMDMDTVDMLLGLLAEVDMPGARERRVTLAEMTSDALAVLSHDPDGFFVMIEGSQPDWLGHDNADLSLVADEVVDFDRAVGAALDYQERHPEVLIVVVADHETGGLALHPDAAGDFVANWTTTNHTAEWIPLFARGPGAARFGGVHDNYVVGRMIMDLLGLEAAPMAGQEP